uniref:Uncharacterized protein n=1 Tax=Globodera rostochiensis TaxID=31243 RepID=A0A914H8G7_GLORO
MQFVVLLLIFANVWLLNDAGDENPAAPGTLHNTPPPEMANPTTTPTTTPKSSQIRPTFKPFIVVPTIIAIVAFFPRNNAFFGPLL